MDGTTDYYWRYLTELANQSLLHLRPKYHTSFFGLAAPRLLNEDDILTLSRKVSLENIHDWLYITGCEEDDWLESTLTHFIEHDGSFLELYRPKDHAHFFRLGCHKVTQYPALLFRLKVFSHCFHVEFQNSLFCAFMATLESVLSERRDDHFVELFICAIGHDIGLLNLERRVVESRREHIPDPSFHEAYIKHVEYSVSFFSKNKFSRNIVRGIQEHHERMDGTGYPKGVSGVRLAEYGQHIHLYDTTFLIYHYKFKPFGKTLADLVPIIEMNSVTNFGAIANLLIEILSCATRSPSFIKTEQEFNLVFSKCLLMADYIKSSTNCIQGFTTQVGFRHEDKKLLTLQNGFLHIALAMHKSQNHNSAMSFIEQKELQGDEETQKTALEDVYFMMREIVYHIDVFVEKLQEYAVSCKDSRVSIAVESTLDALAITRKISA